MHPDPILPELTYFCLPGLLPVLKNTVSFVSGVSCNELCIVFWPSVAYTVLINMDTHTHTHTQTHTHTHTHTYTHKHTFFSLPPFCKIFGYYEEFFSSRFPHTNCKLVFVDEAYQDVSAYSTLCICSTNLLHSHRVIDGVPEARQLIAEVLARQYFGCYITSSSV